MKRMRIGADIQAHGNEEYIREAFVRLQNSPNAELYLASRRHRDDSLNLAHLVQQMGIEDRVHLFPYFSRLEAFPLLKRDCDIWLDARRPLPDFRKPSSSPLLLFMAPFHPGLGEGNSFVSRWWLEKYRTAGWKVHLLWYAVDYLKARNYCSAAAVARAEREYCDLFIEVRPESRLLLRQADGLNMHTDDWCGVELIEKARGLADSHAYDACFVNYAAFSACFENMKPYTEKILCVHDVFTNRNRRMRKESPIPDYDSMSFSEAGEARALARADRVVCFTQNDCHDLRSLCPKPEYTVIAPLPAPRPLLSPGKNGRLNVGYAASGNIFNKANIREFFSLLARDADLARRLRVCIAGPISQYARELKYSGALAGIDCEILGFVEDMDSFFATCDVTINPERGISGIKIKNLDALARGVVTVGTADSFSGLGSDLPIHQSPDIAGLLPMLRDLAENPDFLEKMRQKTRELHARINEGLDEKIRRVVEGTRKSLIVPDKLKKHLRPNHLRQCGYLAEHIDYRDKTLVEIGCDSHLCVAGLFAANGAKKVIACNFNPPSPDAVLPDRTELQICDFCDLEVAPHSVDIVYGFAVLEHIPDFPRLIKKIWTILKSDGVFFLQGEPFFTSANGHHLWLPDNSYTIDQGGKNPVPNWSHLVLSPDEMLSALESGVSDDAMRRRIVNNIYGDENFINRLPPSHIRMMLENAFYCDVETRTYAIKSNEYYQEAAKRFSEADLRASGMRVRGRPGVFVPRNNGASMISVIIPCRNVEEYVGACLESVVIQSYENLEIICVDDKSDDETLRELKRYASRDPRIRVLSHDKREGLGGGRNTGIRAAGGEYIFFLDSDDMLHGRDALKSLVDISEKTDCGVVIGGARVLQPDGMLGEEHGRLSLYETGARVNGREACWLALNPFADHSLPRRAWGTLFGSALWKNNQNKFPPISHEDYPLIPFIYAQAPAVGVLPESIVLYRKRTDSLSAARWGLFEAASARAGWRILRENLETYIPQRVMDRDALKHMAAQFIWHTLFRIESNGIEKDAVGECIEGIVDVAAGSGDGCIPQPFFNDIYERIKALAGLDARPGEALAKMARHLPPENLAAHYRAVDV